MRRGVRFISRFVRCTPTLTLGACACVIGTCLLFSCPTKTMQQKLDVRGADLKAGVDTDEVLDVGGCFVTSTCRAWWRAKTHSPSLTQMISQLRPRTWSRESRCTIGTRRWRKMWPWWRVRSGDPSSATHSSHSFSSVRQKRV